MSQSLDVGRFNDVCFQHWLVLNYKFEKDMEGSSFGLLGGSRPTIKHMEKLRKTMETVRRFLWQESNLGLPEYETLDYDPGICSQGVPGQSALSKNRPKP